jgi:hypothetical protein
MGPARGQRFYCQHVGLSQVGDVNVVADTGAIGGIVVLSKDRDVGTLASGDLQHQGDQVGFRVMASQFRHRDRLRRH